MRCAIASAHNTGSSASSIASTLAVARPNDEIGT